MTVLPEQSRRCYSLHFFYEADGRSFVLSRVRKDHKRVPFPVQFQVIDRLLANGVETVRSPFPPAESGVPWVESRRHYWYVRKARIHDASAWPSDKLVDDAARALGDVHSAGAQLWTTGEQARFFRVDRLDPYHWSVLDVLAGFDKVLDRLPRSPLSRNEADAVRGMAEELRRTPPEALGPIGLTHQDFRPENLLVQDGRVVEIVDWDRARPDHQLYDAVLAGILLAGQDRPVIEQASRFVDTYLAARDLWIEQDAVDWMFRFTAVKNICLSRNPRKWVNVFHALEPAQGPVRRPAGPALEPAATVVG